MDFSKLKSLDLSKLSKLKNPLQAAADWAERMAGDAAAPVGAPRREKPTPPAPSEDAPSASGSAPEYAYFTAAPTPAAPAAPDTAPASQQDAPAELFPRQAPPAPAQSAAAARVRRRRGTGEDLRYLLWSVAIIIGLLGTVVAFFAGALG